MIKCAVDGSALAFDSLVWGSALWHGYNNNPSNQSNEGTMIAETTYNIGATRPSRKPTHHWWNDRWPSAFACRNSEQLQFPQPPQCFPYIEAPASYHGSPLRSSRSRVACPIPATITDLTYFGALATENFIFMSGLIILWNIPSEFLFFSQSMYYL